MDSNLEFQEFTTEQCDDLREILTWLKSKEETSLANIARNACRLSPSDKPNMEDMISFMYKRIKYPANQKSIIKPLYNYLRNCRPFDKEKNRKASI